METTILKPLAPGAEVPASGAPSGAASGNPQPPRRSLLGALPTELHAHMIGLPGGDRDFRARQLFHWMHARGEIDFAAMSNLPAPLRSALAERWQVPALRPAEEVQSRETKTRKFVFEAKDGARIETVRIETPKRVTLCLSSQVGCGFACGYCRTAQMGFVRHLGAAEIADQVLWVRRLASLPDRFNIVFMGMGEPLANYEQVVRAIDLLSHPEGLAVGPRRITVSTVGLAPQIIRLAKERPRVRLAVSLSATTDELRNQLVPVNRRYPLGELMSAVEEHASLTGRRITFEYVLLAGVNDTPADAARLARLIGRVPCKVNLIPYNPTGLDGFVRPSPAAVKRFAEYLYPKTYAVTIRQSQGKDIWAACGQLAQPVALPRRSISGLASGATSESTSGSTPESTPDSTSESTSSSTSEPTS